MVSFLVFLPLAQGADETPAAAPLRIGIEVESKPLSFSDANGEPIGFVVDLVRAVAAARKLEIVFVRKPWQQLLADFKAGHLDALASTVYMPERAQYADFTIAHLALPGMLFMRKGDSSIKSTADLANKIIAATTHGYSEEFAKKNGWGREFLGTRSLSESLEALNTGKADAVIAAGQIAKKVIRDREYRNVTAAPFRMDDQCRFQYHMAVPLGRTRLLYELNAGLLAVRADGTYDRLYEQWIGPLEPRKLHWRDLEPYRLPSVLVLLVLAGAFWHQRRLMRRLHRQKEALRQSEERLTLALEGSQDAFWDWDLTTGRITRSERWGTILGRSSESLQPDVTALNPMIHPDDLERVSQTREIVKHQGHVRVEYRLKGKDGRWHWILDRGKVVARDEQGVPTRVTGAATDITAQKQIGEALGRSQALLEQSQRAAEIGGWEYDLTTGAIYWTLQTYRIHDLDPDTETLTTERVLLFYTPGCREQMKEAFRRAVQEGVPFDLEVEIVTANGRVRWIRNIGRADRNAKGVVRIYGSAQDVTRRRREDEERQRLQQKMLEAQKLESLGVLAGGIAHDFNNLLTVILGNASIAREAPECTPGALQQIETAAQRAGDLCRQMLAYAGKSRSSLESVDLNAIVSDTINLLKLSISKNAMLEFRLAPEPLQVDADASQMRQVIMNFVINASDAIGNTPGKIRVTTQRATVTSEMLRDARIGQELPPGDYIALEVEDNGCGMSPETMARIFDPFFTTKFAGRGLGLAAVLGILRTHRGAFFVSSTLGRGSVFRILLPPGTKKPAIKAAPPHPRRAAGQKGGLILVVDDEPSVRQLACGILEREGYNLAVAADGYEALALALAHGGRFVAVLLDITMPGLNGQATLRELRLMNASLPVLLMSGYSEADARKHVDDDALVDFLPKPFTAEALQQRLSALLARAGRGTGTASPVNS